MPEYVADGDQPVLDVVIHLAGEVAHRQPTLGFAQARRAGAQPLGHGSEQAAERTDLVRPVAVERDVQAVHVDVDRKSTRLNSSHGYISYAVFCLKKKKKKNRCVS